MVKSAIVVRRLRQQVLPYIKHVFRSIWRQLINKDIRTVDRKSEIRINERIRTREVRLIDEDGTALGIMPTMQALNLAREKGIDLVEVSPNAIPPVCRLMDYGRFKYEQAKKANAARKNQKTSELKEIRLRPRTDDHDLNTKTRKILEFLSDGDKVKVSVVFKGRELAHTELGRVVLDKIVNSLADSATIERAPLMEGKMLSMIVSRTASQQAQASKASEQATGKTEDSAIAQALKAAEKAKATVQGEEKESTGSE